MPKFRVVAPDGVAYEVEAPEGATEQDAIAKVRQQYADAKTRRATAGEEVKQEAINLAKVPLIAAGRQADKFVEGAKQLGVASGVAGRELFGLPPVDADLRKLTQMDQVQADNDRVYQPLREKHPFLTGVGETAYLAGVPVTQATAAARVAAPAITAAFNGLMSFGSPQERAKAAVEQGALAGAGGAAGEVVRTAIAPAKSNLTAAQQEALKRAMEKVGYTPRASDLTGNETLRRLEDAIARQPGGAGPMKDLIDKNAAAINRHAARGMGEQADQITPDVFAAADQRLSGTYKDLRSRATLPVDDRVFGAIQNAESFLTKGDPTGAKKEAFDMIQRLKDTLYQSRELDGATYQAWTSDLIAKARELGKTNRTAAAALREVEKAMDKVARGADAPAWQKADREFASMELLMKPRVVNEQTGNVSPLHVASQMERQFGKNWKTGRVDGPIADIASLGRALPPMAEGSQTAGREAFGGLPGWLMAGPTYAASKALTSEFGRDYLSRGLLANPNASRRAAGLLGAGSVPLTIAELEMLLLGQ